jgi:hypothetical protein
MRGSDPVIGAERAFFVCHARKSALGKKIIEDVWKSEERQRKWIYQQQIGRLNLRLKLRDDEYVRRQNKTYLSRDIIVPRKTTGFRANAMLPKDRQSFGGYRTYHYYFGA